VQQIVGFEPHTCQLVHLAEAGDEIITNFQRASSTGQIAFILGKITDVRQYHKKIIKCSATDIVSSINGVLLRELAEREQIINLDRLDLGLFLPLFSRLPLFEKHT